MSENSSTEKKADSFSSLKKRSTKNNLRNQKITKVKQNSGRKRSRTSNERESLTENNKIQKDNNQPNLNSNTKTFNSDSDIEKFGVQKNKN